MTSPQPSMRSLGPMAGFLYFAAAVVFLDQLAILAASVYPVAMDSVQWRFGAVGLTAGRTTPFLLADLLLLAAGLVAGHRVLLRTVGALHLVVAVVLLGLVALFTLDALEMRQLLPLDTRAQALASAGRAEVALVAVAAFCLWVGVKVIRQTPAPPSVRSADRRLVIDPRGGSES